jgi:SAM-dependent methyltransferase
MFTASDLIYPVTVPILEAEDAAEVGRQRLLSDLITPLVGRIFPEEEAQACAWEREGKSQARPQKRVSGPVLPSGLDLSGVHTVLEVGCGQGDWVLDLAFAHPELEIAGIDASRLLIDTGNLHACDQMLTNASFGLVDLVQPPFDFSDESFDLITASFLSSRLEEAQFPPLLSECARLLKPGGWMRLVECEAGHCSSPAIEHLSLLYAQAIQRAGLHPIPANRAHDLDGKGALRLLLTEAGLEVCAAPRRRLSFALQEEAYASMRLLIALFFEEIKPFVLRMQVAEEATFSDLVEQAAREIRLPSFKGIWHLLVLWARKSEPVEHPERATTKKAEQTGGRDVDFATG